MKVSIVIRAFNEEKHLGRLLTGISHQTHSDIEIVLVDSGSTDSTVEIARKFQSKIVSIKPEQFSFGYALNVGCRAASGDILIFASAHIYPVYEDWVEKMVAPFRQDEKIALVYGKQRGTDITKFSEHQIFECWFPDKSDYNQKHPFCNNANAAIRKDLWIKFPYDESLTGLEDLDWAKKVMAEGHKIVYEADAEIIHVHEETPLRIFNRYRREALALRAIDTDQHFSVRDLLRLVPQHILSDYLHAFQSRQFVKNIFDIPVFRIMQFAGTFRGFREPEGVSDHLKRTFYYPKGLKRGRNGGDDPRAKRRIDYSEDRPKPPKAVQRTTGAEKPRRAGAKLHSASAPEDASAATVEAVVNREARSGT